MAGKKILVADDSLTIQKVIRLALSGDGYEIQTVSDGQEAVEQASLFRPDICIIDVSLPTKDAYQIRQEFLSKPDLKNIPMIMMSSAFEKVDEQRMNSLGFAGHLIKPFDPSHLRSTLLSVSTVTEKVDPIEESVKLGSPKTLFNFDISKSDPEDLPAYRTPITPALGTNEPAGKDILADLPPLGESSAGGLNKEVQPMDDIQQLAKNTFEMSGLDQQDWGVIEPMKEEPLQHMPGNLSTEPHYTSAPQTLALSHNELETMVKHEVEQMFAQMRGEIQERIKEIFEVEYRAYAQSKMPELAERVLKEEIHKLLSEPPV